MSHTNAPCWSASGCCEVNASVPCSSASTLVLSRSAKALSRRSSYQAAVLISQQNARFVGRYPHFVGAASSRISLMIKSRFGPLALLGKRPN